jgi:ribulose-5-phosphate 4-epimerase/fuculose-1-phosphate aldolase
MAVSAMKCGLLPLSQTATRFFEHTGYHDFEGPAIDLGERERLVRDLNGHNAMILRNHGLLTMGATVGEAFELMYYLDTACQIQIDAQAAGRVDVLRIDEETARKGYEQFLGPGGAEVDKVWTAMLRMLDRKGIDYRS